MRVAVCQISVVDSDIEGNLARIEAAAQKARRSGADIACFPEAALIGWGNPQAAELARPIPGAHSRRLSATARRAGIALCVGLHELDGASLYNTALLIDPQGAILHHHRKVNLIPDVEAPPTVPGPIEGLRVVETRLGRIGLMICADSFLPAHRQALRLQQPDVALIPYAWAAPAGDWPQHGEKLRATIEENAREIGCPVVGADGVGVMTGGPWKDYLVGGCSTVCLPDGTRLASLPYGVEALQVVAL